VAQFAGLVHLFVATRAQCDQILFFIAARSAAEFEMVYLQVLHATADLAAPAVALQYLSLQFGIARRIESESRDLKADGVHEAFWATAH
jgi:hypothetical protein